MATITGTAGADTLVGTDDADVINGPGGTDGDDVIDGRNGSDQLFGGAGNDLLEGGEGDDLLNGGDGGEAPALIDGLAIFLGRDTASYASATTGVTVDLLLVGAAQATGQGNDTLIGIENLVGGAFADTLSGDVGANVLFGGAGADRLFGREGDDIVAGEDGDDYLEGGAGADHLLGGLGSDVLLGGAGNDILHIGEINVSAGNDEVYGEEGDDVVELVGDQVASVLSGGAGIDTVRLIYGQLILSSFSSANGFEHFTVVTENANFSGTADDNLLDFSGLTARPLAGRGTILRANGGLGDDTLIGGAGDTSDVLHGDRGHFTDGDDDVLYGMGGNDFLYGDGGHDILYGGEGDDTLVGGDGDDALYGGNGNDYIQSLGWGNDTIHGGDGNDLVEINGVILSVEGGAGIDTLTTGLVGEAVLTSFSAVNGFERFGGGSFRGTSDNNFLDFSGLTSATPRVLLFISAGNGDDIVTGISTGAENALYGEGGRDTLRGGSGNDRLSGGDDADDLWGGFGDDLLSGGSDSDTILGGGGSDTLQGDAGDDICSGGDGDDHLNGGSGTDSLDGGAGNDRLEGGDGWDTLDGGAGSDTAVFSGNRISYTITWSGTTATVVHWSGTDIVSNCEFLQFDDQTVLAPTVQSPGGITQSGDAGANTLDGTDFADTLNGLGGDDVLNGLGGNDSLDGGAGDDVLRGGGGDDLIEGGADADLLIGGAGSDTITGGGGVDRAVYSGLYLGYAQTTGGFAGMTIRGGPEGGTDTVSGVEHVQFLDGHLSFETDSWQSVVYRMYDAAFDRGPDPFGMVTWTQALAGGMNLSVLSDTFEASFEFQQRYGHLNNEAFIAEMYRYSLNREPDAPGLQHWLNFMNGGMSRAEVLYHFSESQEHKNVMTARILAEGMWIQDENTIAIARLYDSILDKLPDIAGLRSYRNQMTDGTSLLQVAQSLMTQPEYQTLYGGLSNQAFVEKMYQVILNRAGTASEIATLTAQLDGGAARADLLVGLSQTIEHAAAYQRTWNQQVRTLENGLYPSSAPEADGKHAAEVLPGADDDGGVAEVLPGLGAGDKDGPVAEVSPLTLDAVDAWNAHILRPAGDGPAFEAPTAETPPPAGIKAEVLPEILDDGFVAEVLPGATAGPALFDRTGDQARFEDAALAAADDLLRPVEVLPAATDEAIPAARPLDWLHRGEAPALDALIDRLGPLDHPAHRGHAPHPDNLFA